MLKHSFSAISSRKDVYRAKLVFYLFLLSLAVFFAASLVSYAIIRANAFRDAERFQYLPLEIPVTFWVSTAFLVLVSWQLHRAVLHVRQNHINPLVRSLSIATIFAIAFVALQAQGLIELYQFRFAVFGASTKSYAICFTLGFLHALHVAGGLAFLGFILIQAIRRRYDHERHWPIDNCASYWHFLDIVWLLMLVTFVVAR